MGNFAENLNLGNRFRPPPALVQMSRLEAPMRLERNLRYVMFQESVDYFEIEHKTCWFGVGGAVPP